MLAGAGLIDPENPCDSYLFHGQLLKPELETLYARSMN